MALNDDNYAYAVKTLKDEFLNVPKLVNHLLEQILEKAPPRVDAKFEGLRVYVAEIRGCLIDLKTHKVDLTEPDSGGYKFVSHIVVSKIPSVIKKLIVAKCQTNYSTLDNRLQYVISEYVTSLSELSLTYSIFCNF